MTEQQIQQLVYDTARACGLGDVQAKIIVGQATHESGHFTSNVFKTDNNLFGMKMPSIRPKTYIARPSTIVMKSEGSTPYAHYNSVQDSVKDLILGWHKDRRTDWTQLTTPTAYANYLKAKGYYGGPLTDYINSIASTLRKLTWLKPVAMGGGLIALLVIVTILLTYKS